MSDNLWRPCYLCGKFFTSDEILIIPKIVYWEGKEIPKNSFICLTCYNEKELKDIGENKHVAIAEPLNI